MDRVLSRRPSPAMLVALVALFVALGGSAYAGLNLPRGSVGTAQLQRGAVTTAKLHSDSVTASKVKDHSLLATDFKSGQLPQGPQGAQGPPGPANGPAGGDLTGSYPDPSIAAGAVTNSKLANPALTINPGAGLSGGGSIALGGSGTLSLADGGITTPKFAPTAQAPDSAKLAGLPATDYGAVLSGRINALTTTAGGTSDFGAASGTSTAGSEASVDTLSPDEDLSARDFTVQLTNAPGSGNMRLFYLVVNHVASGLYCLITDPATTCSATGPVSVPAGSTLALEDTIASANPTAAASDARFAFRLTP